MVRNNITQWPRPLICMNSLTKSALIIALLWYPCVPVTIIQGLVLCVVKQTSGYTGCPRVNRIITCSSWGQEARITSGDSALILICCHFIWNLVHVRGQIWSNDPWIHIPFFFIPMTLSIYSFFALKQQNNTAVNIEILSTSNPPPLNQPPPNPRKKKTINILDYIGIHVLCNLSIPVYSIGR